MQLPARSVDGAGGAPSPPIGEFNSNFSIEAVSLLISDVFPVFWRRPEVATSHNTRYERVNSAEGGCWRR